jgi:hypothetical protein
MADPTQRGSGYWAWLAGIPLALWLAVTRVVGATPSAAQPSAAPTNNTTAQLSAAPTASSAAQHSAKLEIAAAPSPLCLSRFLTPFYAMAGAAAPSIQADANLDDWTERVAAASQKLHDAFRSQSAEVLIATVPDPIDSGLSYAFETGLQAVRRGLEQGDVYFRDRSWLPWDDREVEQGKQQREVEACRATLPGVMLFRGGNADDGGRLVMLLIVGESPNTGLRQLAMKRALDVAERFGFPDAAAGPRHGSRRIRVVGPTFSGSAQSLRNALRAWSDDNPSLDIEYRVVSGTATGAAVPSWLGGKLSPLTNSSKIGYRATTVPAALLECSYLHFLRDQFNVDTEPEPVAGAGVDEPQKLEGVATLSESGTEFGATLSKAGAQLGSATRGARSCGFRSALSFHFPFHVSALRDAYETLDKSGPAKDTIASHAVALDASLHETRLAVDVEGSPSPKANTAEDLSLGALLELISTRHVRHLAIRATDVGDAIFLARRVRDVAPDVRLAFFDSDVLLLHPSFQRQLLGSLVITPYPFHGLTELSTSGTRVSSIDGFVSGHAQGVFNAVVAQRSVWFEPERLSGYDLGSTSPLPIWVTSIGRHGLVPLRVAPSPDCAEVIYGTNRSRDPELDQLCGLSDRSSASAGSADRRKAWQTFHTSHAEAIHFPSTGHLPYAWQFLFAILSFALLVDRALQNRNEKRLAKQDFPNDLDAGDGNQDQDLDLAIGRCKWRLYSVIRTFLFALCLTYMSAVYWLTAFARDGQVNTLAQGVELAVVSAVLLGALVSWAVSLGDFLADYKAFSKCVGATMLPRSLRDIGQGLESSDSGDVAGPSEADLRARNHRTNWVGRISLTLGVAHPIGRERTARVSFSQLRLLVVVSFSLACVFSCAFILDVNRSANIGSFFLHDSLERARALSRLTLYALRCADLTSGISPAPPAFFCMLSAYVWAVGRMSRLALAHATSRLSPLDGEADLVSTPVRLILHPNYSPDSMESDAGFTHVERNLLNAIWRPITGRYYVTAAIALAFFPLVLFILKPPSTLTGRAGTFFLSAGLALSVYLIGITIVQLLQYWSALKRFLKRILEHPLGEAFATVPPFARDSVDHQVSRLPDEELRWSACAQQFCDLMREISAIEGVESLSAERAALLEVDESGARPADRLTILRQSALARAQYAPSAAIGRPSNPGRETELRAEAEATLGQGVIHFAHLVTKLLERPWSQAAKRKVEGVEAQPVPAQVTSQLELSLQQAVGDDTTWTDGAIVSERVTGEFGLWPAPRAVARITASSAPPAQSSTRGVLDGADAVPIDALSAGSSAYTAAEMKWFRKAQTFVATVVTLLVQRHVRQFRYFVQVTTGCGLLLLLAVANYPFEPYRLLLTFIWLVMVTVVGTDLWVFVQLDRNMLISLISGTDPKVTFDGALILRVFAWAIVPLLSVAAAQYPEFADALYKLLSPFEHALR